MLLKRVKLKMIKMTSLWLLQTSTTRVLTEQGDIFPSSIIFLIFQHALHQACWVLVLYDKLIEDWSTWPVTETVGEAMNNEEFRKFLFKEKSLIKLKPSVL